MAQPTVFGQLVLLGAHLYAVAALQLGENRTKSSVDTRILGMIAHVGVDLVGKVEYGRALGQNDGVALGREDDHVVVVERRDNRLHESTFAATLGHIAQHATELLDPVLHTLGTIHYAAQLRVALHRLGADMHLGPLSHLRHHLHMNRLVAVLLGLVDVVDERIGTLVIEVGEYRIDTQTLVLLRHVKCLIKFDDNVHLMHMLQLLERLAGILHLAPEGIDRTRTSIDMGYDAIFFQSFTDGLDEGLDIFAMHPHVTVDLRLDANIFLGRTPSEREVFELRLDLVESQAIGQGSIEVVGLRRNFHLLVGAHRSQGTHVVHTVGQFDEQGTDIVVDRVKHVLEVVNLLRYLVVAVRILGQDSYQVSHIFAETHTKVLHCHISVLHHIVQQSRHHGIGLEAQFDQRNTRHGYRVRDIWDATLSDLFRVSLGSQFEGCLDARNIIWWQQLCHAVEELPSIFFNNLLSLFRSITVLHKHLPFINLYFFLQFFDDTKQLLTQPLQPLYHFLTSLIARHILIIQFSFCSLYRQSFDPDQTIEDSYTLHILLVVQTVVARRASWM